MAHALGSVETVFSFARLGVHASHYWIWPANRNDGTGAFYQDSFTALSQAQQTNLRADSGFSRWWTRKQLKADMERRLRP